MTARSDSATPDRGGTLALFLTCFHSSQTYTFRFHSPTMHHITSCAALPLPTIFARSWNPLPIANRDSDPPRSARDHDSQTLSALTQPDIPGHNTQTLSALTQPEIPGHNTACMASPSPRFARTYAITPRRPVYLGGSSSTSSRRS